MFVSIVGVCGVYLGGATFLHGIYKRVCVHASVCVNQHKRGPGAAVKGIKTIIKLHLYPGHGAGLLFGTVVYTSSHFHINVLCRRPRLCISGHCTYMCGCVCCPPCTKYSQRLCDQLCISGHYTYMWLCMWHTMHKVLPEALRSGAKCKHACTADMVQGSCGRGRGGLQVRREDFWVRAYVCAPLVLGS